VTVADVAKLAAWACGPSVFERWVRENDMARINPKWLRLAGELLELASEKFSNKGCNDWDWPADFTDEDRQKMAAAMVAGNVGKSVSQLTADETAEVADLARRGPPDWWVMSFLAKRLSEGR
jgi:hypothetical protein